MPFRRRREGKTNYGQRRGLIKSRRLRFVVRSTLSHTIAQFVEAKLGGDVVHVSATSKELAKSYGWKAPCGNLPAAYLTGFLAGQKAKKLGLTEAILDVGVGQPLAGSKIYGALKGVVDAGIAVPHDEEIIPDEARIRGEHILNYWKRISETEARQHHFSRYLEGGLTLEDLPKHFDEVKAKIERG